MRQAWPAPEDHPGAGVLFAAGAWVDARIQAAKRPVTRIAFASADYFSLLKKRPELAAVLALGRNVRFVADGRVSEIFDPGDSGE